MPILDHVPDVIRKRALKDGVLNVGDAPSDGLAGYMPAALQKAYQTGDYNTIQNYTTMTANDLNPIYQNIQNNQNAAFFEVENKSDGTVYNLSISGHPDNPNGYMWVYAYPPSPDSGSSRASGTTGSSTPPKLTQVAQIGTYSSSGQTLSISNRIWSDTTIEVTASIISTIVTTIVFKYLKNFMTSQDSDSAMEVAATEAGEELVDDGVVTAVDWAGMVAGMSAFGVGIVAGAIIFFFFLFITNYIDVTFTLAVNIYNWDPNHSYIVNNPYEDNAVISGGQTYTPQTIDQPTNEIKLPDGFAPTVQTVYSYLTVTFTNSQTIAEGLGIGMIVQSSDGSTGFGLKYDCPWSKSNTLGLTGGVNDPEGYYEDPNTWAPEGSYGATSTLPEYNIPLSCTTTALSGASDHFYQFDVHIGLEPQSGPSTPAQDQQAVSLVKPPARAPTVRPGDTIRLPTGKTVGVLKPASRVRT
ncbi:hypothetical protein CNMCM5623_007338 [Aspergillus felis]|uniref:Uncharacterized protein n=1 Tax=Aspergillus felis TaxID=1287682 RepID=A0A8H6UP36_9EURO|nr:hypothetical protein CNMCM5623_007338 [Aspergillus felis]